MPPRRPRRQNRKRVKVMGGRKRTVNKVRRQVHMFKRTAYIGTVTASISAAGTPSPVASAFAFSLSQVPNVSEFSSLFDQYKLTGVRMRITPALTQGISSPLFGTSAALGYSKVHTAIDYDDNTAPTSEDELLEYGSLKSTTAFKDHTRYIKPKLLQQVYRSALSTSYAPKSSVYLDMATSDVPHFGLKLWVSAPNTPAGTAGSISYKIYQTMYFTCKNVR